MEHNKGVVEADAASDGFFVLSDLYYEGWKTFVDGGSRKVYKADYIFRAGELTRGQHIVGFVFDPLSFWAWVVHKRYGVNGDVRFLHPQLCKRALILRALRGGTGGAW